MDSGSSQSKLISVQCLQTLFFFYFYFGHHTHTHTHTLTVAHTHTQMSNDCLFVELKEVVNYAVSVFLQKTDELPLCRDVVLRNKTPVNHTPSGVFTICLPTDSLFPLIAHIQLIALLPTFSGMPTICTKLFDFTIFTLYLSFGKINHFQESIPVPVSDLFVALKFLRL